MMKNQLAALAAACLSIALPALPVVSIAQTPTTCWDAPVSEAVSTCTSAWVQSPASATCSNAAVIVYPGTTGQGRAYCTCSIDATCTKDDGVTTMLSGVATNNPDDYTSVVNCNGQISFDACAGTGTETE